MSNKIPPAWITDVLDTLWRRNMPAANYQHAISVIENRAPDAEALAVALEQAGHYMADLNGSEWIKGDDAGSLDMKQRARTQQARINKALAAYRAAHPKHSSTE